MQLLFDYFKDGEFFAGLDLLDGYFQHPIAEESKYLTTFITPFGLFQFNYLPMGIAQSPGIFSQAINGDILKDAIVAKDAVNYIDDCGVCGKSATEFLDRLERVLAQLHARNARVKFAKCVFGFKSLQFCGHVFDKAGYRLSEARKQGLVDMPQPTTLKQLRGFLGLCQYFAKFVPHLSELLAPITNLTEKSAQPFRFTAEAVAAFVAVKDAILQSGGLCHIEEGGELVLHTDASVTGVGGYLVQRIRGEERPIAYVSHRFSKAASNWSTIEQEAYAIVYCVLKLEAYLLGRTFRIKTDHKNLIYILGSTIPKIVRWRLRLAEYDFSIDHIAGVDNVVADNLSRLLAGIRVDVPDNAELELEQLLQQLHNGIVGHHGRDRTEAAVIEVLGKDVYDAIPNARARLRTFIRECGVCQKIKDRTDPYVDPSSIVHHLGATRPFSSVSVDTLGPFPADEFGNCYVQAIMCNANRLAMGVPTKTNTESDVIGALLLWVSIFGWFDSIRSDQGSNVTSNLVEALVAMFGAKHIAVVAQHHQANGYIERRFREVNKHLRAMLFNAKLRGKWSLAVPVAFAITNSAIDRMTGVSPSRLTFGPFANGMDAFRVRAPAQQPASMHQYLRELDEVITTCRNASQAHLTEQTRMEDRRRPVMKPNSILQPGDYVLYAYAPKVLPRAPTKLHPILKGPLMVVDRKDDVITCMDIVTKGTMEVHTSQLRQFLAPDHILPDQLLEWALADHQGEFIVESVEGHRFTRGKRKSTSSMQLRIRWAGYEGTTWERYAAVKEAALVDDYVKENNLPRTKERGEVEN